jgi:polysaccharide biosynthesis protein PslG
VVLAVAVVVYALYPVPETPPAPVGLAYPGEVIGVTANSLDGNTAAEQDLTNDLGAGWLREELRWSTIEPAPGRFDFTRYDALVQSAAARGLRVLPVLFQSPRWLSPAVNRLPTQLAAWRRFVDAVVRRYKPGGAFWRARTRLDPRLAPRVWEIWNEPYLRTFDDLGPRPAAYANLVRATVEAGRAADSGARFLTAAETTYIARGGTTRNWLRDVSAAIPGFGAWIDLLSVHPYTPGPPDTTTAPRGAQLRRIDDLQGTLVDLGIGRRHMWLTEFGWSTCTVKPCVTPEKQAQYWEAALKLVAGEYRDSVDAVFPYRLTDIQGTGQGDSQAKFGLVTFTGTRKPAFAVVHRAALQAGAG